MFAPSRLSHVVKYQEKPLPGESIVEHVEEKRLNNSKTLGKN